MSYQLEDVRGFGALGLSGLGALDPGLTTAAVIGNALGWASTPALIGAVLYGVKKKGAARTFFIIAGIAGGVGAAAAVLAAQKMDETLSVGL